MNRGGSSNTRSNHLSQLPFQKVGSSRTNFSSNNNHKLTPGFHYNQAGEDHYNKCQNSILSQLSYPINDSKRDGITHHPQFVGTPSFFAQQHPTPPSLRVRHTRNDSCYSNNGLLSLGDEESNVGPSNTAKHTSPPPRATKQIHCTNSSATQLSPTNSVAPSAKLRRSTSLRQHQSAAPPTPTIPFHNRNTKTGNNNVTNGIIHNHSTSSKKNCTHSHCSETSLDSSLAKKVPNKHESNSSQIFNNNYIVRNTRSGVNKSDCCYTDTFKNHRDYPNNNIATCSPSENSLIVANRDPEIVSNIYKLNNPSSNSVTPLPLRSGKQRQIHRRSTSSPSPSRTGHETTSSSQHSSRQHQKKEQQLHNKTYIPAQQQNSHNNITANKNNSRNGNYTPNITGAANNTISRNGCGANEFRHGTHTRSSSACSYQKTPIKGYQQNTITSIRRSRERRSQNSPSLTRIPSFSRTPSLRRSEKTASNTKKCTTNKRALPNMGNVVGSTASLASSTCSGVENGQWSSYPSSCNQIIQTPPEPIALRYENEKTNCNNQVRPMSMHPHVHSNPGVVNTQYQQPQNRPRDNFHKNDNSLKKDQMIHQNSLNEKNCTYPRNNTMNTCSNTQSNTFSSNKPNHLSMSNMENNFQRHGSYSSFHFGTNNSLGKNMTNIGIGNNSRGVMSCLHGNQAHIENFQPISKKNSASSFQLSNSSQSPNNQNNAVKSNKMNNNFLLRSLSLRKGNNYANDTSSSSPRDYQDIMGDTKFSLKPFGGLGSTFFNGKNQFKHNYTLDEAREDELNNGGPASLATSLPCLNNAIMPNVGGERHRINQNYPLSSNLCHRKGSLASKKKSSSSNNSSNTSTTKSSPSSTSTTPSSSSLVLNSLPYQNLPPYQQPHSVNNHNKRKNGSKEKQKIALSASSSSGLGSSGSSGTSSPNQRTSGGTSGHSTTLHAALESSTNISLPVSTARPTIPANVTETTPKKRVPITDDPEGHLAYLPGDVLLERYEVGKY